MLKPPLSHRGTGSGDSETHQNGRSPRHRALDPSGWVLGPSGPESGNTPYPSDGRPGSVIAGGCKIGSGTFVGTNATINPYINVTAGCVIGSGSVVVKDCLVEGVYFGNPAKLSKSNK